MTTNGYKLTVVQNSSHKCSWLRSCAARSTSSWKWRKINAIQFTKCSAFISIEIPISSHTHGYGPLLQNREHLNFQLSVFIWHHNRFVSMVFPLFDSVYLFIPDLSQFLQRFNERWWFVKADIFNTNIEESTKWMFLMLSNITKLASMLQYSR